MFKLFNKKDKPRIIDKVFIHTNHKWAYCQKFLSEHPKTIYIAWFDDTIEEIENHFSKTGIQVSVLKARTASHLQIEGFNVVFIEHYPMKTTEGQFIEKLKLKEAVFLTAVDEPLLKYFGGEKLITILESMGMKEDETIEHKMISQSIENAQHKIESKVSFEQSARSQAEWMERNLK